jgi:hypothetical protein
MTTIQLDALHTAQRLTTELRHNVARLLTLDGHDADLAAIAMRGAEMASDALWKLDFATAKYPIEDATDAKQRSGAIYEIQPQ